MTKMKSLVLASACVFLVATATAQERPAGVAAGADAAVKADGFGGTGSHASLDPVALGWNWYLPLESWSYYNGSSQRLWAEFRNSGDKIETYAYNDQAQMINHATSGNHWLGIYWTSGTAWSSSRLWYY